jgi:hypothetical protein
MANRSLSDPTSAINSSSSRPGFSRRCVLDLEDFMEEHLSKLKALVSVALTHGLHGLPEATQYHYWMMLDEQLSHVSEGMERVFHPKNE